MTSASCAVESSFINCHGEEWLFSFDEITHQAFVKGSDVDWDAYPVIEGVAYGLALAEEEQNWLTRAWKEATKGVISVGPYNGIPAEFVIEKSYSSLTDDYCPICLERKIDFEIHHCIWASDGGPDTSSNLLRICNSCHALITRGSTEERIPKDQAAFHHQLMYFGFSLFRHALGADRDSAALFARQHPKTSEFIRLADQRDSEQQDIVDRWLKAHSRIAYQYFRELGLKKLRWSDHVRLIAPPSFESEPCFRKS